MRFSLRRRHRSQPTGEQVRRVRERLGNRSIVLIGMMGAGKTSVGRRLAQRLDLPFADADSEIELAAGKTIAEIFEEHGEAYFRSGERRVIARMLGDGPQVLATGGGAIMDPETRENIKRNAISVWLKADLDLLVKRVKKRNNRPLLKDNDPREVMDRLLQERGPLYAEADLTIESRDLPHETMVDIIVATLAESDNGDGSKA